MPHQEAAVDWLRKNNGRGLIWADAGTGKTFAALAYCDSIRAKKVLIFCPATIKNQWLEEIPRISEGAVSVVDGTPAERHAAWNRAARFYVVNYDVLYEREMKMLDEGGNIVGIRRIPSDMPFILEHHWDAVVADESHRINSPSAKTTKAFKKIPCPVRIALSGDPFPNALHEAWSVVDWIEPGILGSTFWSFKNRCCVPHPVFPGKIVGYRNENWLRGVIAKHFFRVKKEVLTDLPPKVESYDWVDLPDDERRTYDVLENEMRLMIAGAEKLTVPNLLSCLMRLRQLVDFPQVLDSELPESSKMKELKRLLADRTRKVIVFTEFATLAENLKESFGDRAALICGKMNSSERVNEIARFKKEPFCDILFSTAAGGYGLNLTVATRVIHCGIPWNQARVNQRVSRAWRKGQDREVEEIYLMARGTVDEKMKKLVDRKRRMNEKFDAREDLKEMLL